MREASQESYFARLATDTRQFFRSPGLVAVTTVAMSLIVLRFKKNWDDLKGVNDAKRAIAPIRGKIAPLIDRIRYGLGKERIHSTETPPWYFRIMHFSRI